MSKRNRRTIESPSSVTDLALSTLTPDDEGILRLPIKLNKEQLKESFLVSTNDKDGNGMYTYRWVTCAICLESVRCGTDGVYLACKEHAFHGKCIIPHLQQDRRCPTCRFAPQSRKQQADEDAARMYAEDDEDDDDNDNEDESDESDESNDEDDDGLSDVVYKEATIQCADRLLMGFTIEMLNEALARYGVAYVNSRRRAAKALAEQLLYETDDDE